MNCLIIAAGDITSAERISAAREGESGARLVSMMSAARSKMRRLAEGDVLDHEAKAAWAV